MRRAFIVFAVVCAFTSGCFPPALDVTGLSCDATRECGEGYQCRALRCATASAPLAESLVDNGSFEQLAVGGPAGWRSTAAGALSSSDQASFDGSRSARLSFDQNGLFGALKPARAPVAGADGVHCARALVSGTTRGLSRLELGGGGLLAASEKVPVSEAWTDVRARFSVRAGEPLMLLLLLEGPGPSEVLLVDDVQLWRSEDGNCDER